MACPDCKAEGMDSLYKCGEERDCLIHVSTDVLTVGVDIPGLAAVVIYDKILSPSGLMQRTGRPVRERGTKGFAYIYVSKANMAEAMAYINSEAGKQDKRVLEAKDPTSHIRAVVPHVGVAPRPDNSEEDVVCRGRNGRNHEVWRVRSDEKIVGPYWLIILSSNNQSVIARRKSPGIEYHVVGLSCSGGRRPECLRSTIDRHRRIWQCCAKGYTPIK
jgi:hypothetical protein